MTAEAIVATTSPPNDPINSRDRAISNAASNVPSAQRCFSNLYLITKQLKAVATPIMKNTTNSIIAPLRCVGV